ncbi:MAG TPA: hypothetical protein VE818_00785 [Nitrososphaeraceae archaeon]|nr:hypothetical protein [Nitrososphaeraceae archaeon]
MIVVQSIISLGSVQSFAVAEAFVVIVAAPDCTSTGTITFSVTRLLHHVNYVVEE